MGHTYSKPEDRLRFISREVNSLKSSLRSSRQNISKESKTFIVETLAKQSSEVSSMNGKVKRKHMDETLRNISETMEEVLKIEPSELDGGTVESDSFVNVPIKRGRAQGSSQANPQNSLSRSALLSTVRDVEENVAALKTEIRNAIDSNNSGQLKVLLQRIKSLATDLELVQTKSDSFLEQRKANVYKKIMSLNYRASKALKDLKKYEEPDQRKQKSMADLSLLEAHLVENQSLLNKSIKEKSPVDAATIRNNIVDTNRKLANIDLVDNEVKEKAAFLSQKITETVNILDGLMAKREFDSKFSNFLETFGRIVRNFDSTTNTDGTLNQLQRLRNSLEHLEEISDTTKNRKILLLNDINRQISNIQASKKESDEKIIQEIVEDNVVLRKHHQAQSKNEEHTVIDQFINHWDLVKSNFDVNCYSDLALLRIDGILGQMQHSINDLRIDIAKKCDTNIPGSLNAKLSQSAPKLNDKKRFGSSRSLNQLDTKIIRTKAKIYNNNLSTVQFVNGENQHQLSKLARVEQQVRFTKEKIGFSQNDSTLRAELERYLKDVDEFVNDSDENVAARAQAVFNDIMELLCKSLLADYKEQFHALFNKVHLFNGTRYDKEFDDVKNDLVKIQLKLEHFNVPPQYVSLTQEKGELIENVCSVIDSLQEKGSHHKKYEGENVKHLKEKLHDLNEKVKRFSGTYKSVVYNTIERELNRLLLYAGEHVEEKVWSDEITKEAEKLLKILEQRAHRTQSFKAAKPEEKELDDQVGMTKIKRDLSTIKKEIDKTPENNVTAFVSLQSRLDLVNFELSQIVARSNENLAKEKEICSNEVQTLKNVVDAKVALQQKPVLQWPERELQTDLLSYIKNDVNADIKQIENSFLMIKKEIAAPTNKGDVHKYYKLAQDIKTLMEKLGRHTFATATDDLRRIKQLRSEMQHYVDVLEKEVDDVNYVRSMEEKIDKLKSLFESEQKHDLQAMAKELQAIQKKLQEHHLNSSSSEMLRSRKTSVQQITDDLTQKLRKLEQNENQELMEETRKIEECERKVRAFAPEILTFTGLKTDDKFYELNEATIRTIIVLDKLHIRNAELQKRRIKLLKELHLLGEALDERAQQAQQLVNLEQDLDNISTMLNNAKDLQLIKSKMDAVRLQLQELEVTDGNLASRKDSCIEQFHALFNALDNEHDTFGRIAKDLEDIAVALNATNDKNQLQDFDEALTKYTMELLNLKCEKDSPQHSRVLELYQKIENLSLSIEAKIDSDLLRGISDKIDRISNKMNAALTQEQIGQLYEELIKLQDDLGKIDSASLKAEKDACVMRLILCQQEIADFRKSAQSTHV